MSDSRDLTITSNDIKVILGYINDAMIPYAQLAENVKLSNDVVLENWELLTAIKKDVETLRFKKKIKKENL